uniref:O-succinylbenzoic acid-CoA ligase n=1 Tax=Sciadococcus taiwanensis TaxID=3028030 RepID=A0A9Y1I200_9RHOD|nr:O-succinylbenzoic acid-CoA ligase [Sciadococcus taiwanensis]
MTINKLLCPLSYISLIKTNNVVFSSPNHYILYKELDCLATSLFFFFKRINLSNRSVLVVTNNSVLLTALYFAALKSNNTIIPFNVRGFSSRYLNNLRLSKIDLVIGDKKWLKFIADKNWGKLFSLEYIKYQLNTQFTKFIFYKFYSQNISIYNLQATLSGISTSGSTGNSKICYHTLTNHLLSVVGLNKYTRINYLDKWWLVLPVSHVSGFTIILRTLFSYATVLISINFKNKQSIERILESSRVTFFSLVNTHLYRLRFYYFFQEFLSNLRCILIGGSKANIAMFSQTKFPPNTLLCFTYGLSETFSQIFITQFPNFNLSTLLPYRQFKLLDKSHIIVRGGILLQKYDYSRKILYSRKRKFMQHFWFLTQDRAKINTQHGCFIRGRIDSLFARAGENISPEEIEYELNKLSNVIFSIVIPIFNEELDYVPIAYLHLQNVNEFNEGSIKASLERALPKHKIPMKFFIMPSQFTLAIKVNRHLLKSYYYQNN